MPRRIYLTLTELVAVENLIAALWAAFNNTQITAVTLPPSGTIAWHPEGVALFLSSTHPPVTDDIQEILDAQINAHDKETCPVCGESTYPHGRDPDWRICNGCGANYPIPSVQNGG